MDHMQQPVYPVHDTPPERCVTEGQIKRNGKYTNAFGEEKTFDWAYNWVMQMGWVWSIAFPIMAIRDMAPDEDEFERVFKIVFATAGKNQFMDPSSVEGIRSYLGVPHEVTRKDSRIMGSYIKFMLDCQLVPCELTAFTQDETRIVVDADDFNGRYEMAPVDEITTGYEVLWHNAVKTMVDAEFSVWFENKDTDHMEIVVGHKIDKMMI